MNVIALLCWYEEKPEHLGAMVESIAPLCSTLVAVDGAYEGFPGARAGRSRPTQVDMLRGVTEHFGMDLLTHEPIRPWAGQEVEKRSFLFRAGEMVSRPDDWYLVIDGDERLADMPRDLIGRLRFSPYPAAEVSIREPLAGGGFGHPQHFRRLLRAERGLAVGPRHYDYVTPDGRHLMGDTPVEALDLRDEVLLTHHRAERATGRAAAADDWGDLLRKGVHG